MHRDLIISAFAKAKKEEYEEFGISASTNKASQRLEAYISLESKIPYSARSLRNCHNDATDVGKVCKIIQPEVVNALCKYVGFESYAEYLKVDRDENLIKKDIVITSDRRPLARVYLWSLLLGIFTLIALVTYLFSNQQKWMVWEENHYREISFDKKLLQEGKLKLFKLDRINDFKKVNLNCNTVFFYPDGAPKFWYGKNGNKELEFFTALGKHPETGKSLKPLSKYMIAKYICSD